MNTIRLICFGLIAINIYSGMKKGLVATLVPVASQLVTIIFLTCTKSIWQEIIFGWMLEEYSLIMIRAAVIIILYFCIMTIVKLILQSLKLASKLPIVRVVNRLLGSIAGVVSGMLAVWVFLAVIYLCKDYELGVWAIPQIQSSAFLSFLYEHNLITYLVQQF